MCCSLACRKAGFEPPAKSHAKSVLYSSYLAAHNPQHLIITNPSHKCNRGVVDNLEAYWRSQTRATPRSTPRSALVQLHCTCFAYFEPTRTRFRTSPGYHGHHVKVRKSMSTTRMNVKKVRRMLPLVASTWKATTCHHAP